ncbi:MAG: arginine--tRNA ligase [Halarchaeum sp.]
MFLALRAEVEDALRAALADLDLPTDDLGIEEPPEGVDAVLASSAAFRLAGELGAAPPAVAERVADAVDTTGYEYLSAVRAQGPYVNALPTPAYYADTLDAGRDDDYGELPATGQDVLVEHTSANPTGPVHVGRARNPIVGDAVARLLDYAGHDVTTEYYVNDAGRQMAVFTWAYETFDEDDLESDPERDRIEYDLVRYYRKGNEYLENADADSVEDAESEIQEILQGLEEGDDETYERVQRVVDQVLSGMRACLRRLPAEFDEFVKETEFMRDGATRELADRLKERPEAAVEDGAWQLDLSERGYEKKLVFLRSDGTSLYTTRDLAHHEWKFDAYDRSVTVLGEDHKLQAGQLQATLDLLGNDTDQLDNVIYSYVNLPEGKMSTRAGTGVDLDDLLDEAVRRARDEVETRLDDRIRDDDVDEDDVERIAEQVGVGAVRYDIVSKQPQKAITFEWEDALDFEAQSAPYIQYAHARCCGILDNADVPERVDASVLDDDAEIDLLRETARFPGVVDEAATDLEPHQIATFAREYADAFNAFYRECPVLADDVDPAVRGARLALVASARNTLANALDVLGVEAPTSM